ncbi:MULTISPECIES: GTP cyclohydrolase II [unclassified Streptomyces]|uniref:GTP cyclohydrolase II n=1 Tax=unclassified Streptomyces TaxID=2593676 RepID=UPI00339E2630
MTENYGVLGGTAQLSGVERVVIAPLPTVYGDFQAVGYLDHDRGEEQVALVHGEVGDQVPDGGGEEGVLTRLHSECLTGDAFGSTHCECGPQLSTALREIAAEGRGILVYLRGHEGRGIGLLAKLRAMKLQAEGLDTVEANLAQGLPVDARDYRVAAEILHDLGVRSVRLLSNNPRKREALQQGGIKVAEQVPLLIPPCEENLTYLLTKRERLDHYLPHLDAALLNSPRPTVTRLDGGHLDGGDLLRIVEDGYH